MPWFKRKPRITDENYGRLMTSFGRVVDRDPLVRVPAQALADRVAAEYPAHITTIDTRLYDGAAVYHLRLLGGAWILAAEQAVPRATAEVFEEAVAWRFTAIASPTAVLPHRLSALARGEGERDLTL
ncbi:MAG TPA: hypothetical protein VFK32_07720 [Tepidiformaceae bacterium]|nr:hypothetical protein [Tepidiformaceae bacterium]